MQFFKNDIFPWKSLKAKADLDKISDGIAINKEVGGVIYHELVVSFEKKLEM